MDDGSIFGPHDQEVIYRRQPEVVDRFAFESRARVNGDSTSTTMTGSRSLTVSGGSTAPDQRIPLIGCHGVDFDSHPVGIDTACKPAAFHRLSQSPRDMKLHQRVSTSLRRHRHHLAGG
jgi:hypothetical protein